MTVVGYRNGVASPPSNTLSFVTPSAEAPLNTAKAASPSVIVIRLTPPALPPHNGGAWCAGPKGGWLVLLLLSMQNATAAPLVIWWLLFTHMGFGHTQCCPPNACRVVYEVTVCPITGPQSACMTKRSGAATRRRLLAVPDTVSFNAVPGTT